MPNGVRHSNRGRGSGRGGTSALAGSGAALQRRRCVPTRQHAAVGPAAGRRHCESYDEPPYRLSIIFLII